MDLKKESIKAFKYSHLMPKLFNNPTRTVLYNKLKILIISYEHYFQIIKTSITKYEMKTITLSKFSSVLSSLSNQTVKKTQFISNFFAFTNTHIIYEHIYIYTYLYIILPVNVNSASLQSRVPSSISPTALGKLRIVMCYLCCSFFSCRGSMTSVAFRNYFYIRILHVTFMIILSKFTFFAL